MPAAIASAAVLLLTATAVTAFAPAPLSLARHQLSRAPAAALRATVQDSAVRPKVDAPWVSPGTLWDCLRHGETFNGAMKLIRDRHGDIVRMYIPVFFGEVRCCGAGAGAGTAQARRHALAQAHAAPPAFPTRFTSAWGCEPTRRCSRSGMRRCAAAP